MPQRDKDLVEKETGRWLRPVFRSKLLIVESEYLREVVLERELDAEIVYSKPIQKILPTSPLELSTEHNVRHR